MGNLLEEVGDFLKEHLVDILKIVFDYVLPIVALATPGLGMLIYIGASMTLASSFLMDTRIVDKKNWQTLRVIKDIGIAMQAFGAVQNAVAKSAQTAAKIGTSVASDTAITQALAEHASAKVAERSAYVLAFQAGSTVAMHFYDPSNGSIALKNLWTPRMQDLTAMDDIGRFGYGQYQDMLRNMTGFMQLLNTIDNQQFVDQMFGEFKHYAGSDYWNAKMPGGALFACGIYSPGDSLFGEAVDNMDEENSMINNPVVPIYVGMLQVESIDSIAQFYYV